MRAAVEDSSELGADGVRVPPAGVACWLGHGKGRPADRGPCSGQSRLSAGTPDKLSRKHREGARQSSVQAMPGDWGRREGLWVTTVQDNSCWGSFSLSQTCTSSASQKVTQA